MKYPAVGRETPGQLPQLQTRLTGNDPSGRFHDDVAVHFSRIENETHACDYTSTMDESILRAWWSHRQGLDGTLQAKTPAQVLEQSGWARSVGGVNPYLTLFS